MIGKPVFGDAMFAHLELPFEGRLYALSLDWTREDFVNEGAVGLVIEASVRDGDRTDKASLSVALKPDEEGELWLSVVLEPGGAEIVNMPVADLVGGESVAARVLDRIPVQVVDPVFGCMLRGGLSAVIDQLTECWNGRPEEVRGREAAWIVLRCVRANGGRISGRAFARFAKCVAFDWAF